MLVPKLRFKEFSDEWKHYNLDDVVTFLDEKRKPIKDSDRKNIKGKYPYYGASGIIDYINDYIFDEELLLLGEDGANIISRSTKLVFKASGKYWVNNHAHVLRPNTRNNIDFLEAYLENLDYKQYNTGTAQPKLNQEVCRKIIVTAPKEGEQKKIGKFISLLDKKIELQTDKVEALKLYKKGLFNYLFSNTKFLKTEKIGNICSITTGKLDANAMVKNGKYRFYTCAKDYYFIDDFAFDDEALLISGNGANVGYIHYYKGKFNAYQRTYVLTNFSENINYIKIYLDHYLAYRINSEKNEGNTPYITISTISEMNIKIPNNIDSDLIVKLISSLDYKTEYEQSKLEKLNKLKKGLLQKMFV